MMHRIDNEDLLLNCLRLFDSSATESISERVGDLILYSKKLMQNADSYCMMQDEEIKGFISFYANQVDTAFLTIIAVDDKEKGSGIGTRLLEQAFTVAIQRGMKSIRLEVHKKNIEAIAFYKKNHFKTESISSHNYIFMTKEL